ncbi:MULTISPECIES: hypothetical protein [unclassified Campylobacter]|uniref:hypothetical protein n=1 Tax=unclassified Campylobacter TaxID=2593542 RepID=UPI0022E9D04D|nr:MULTISPECIES: hypothetical protein [unclassified Campylobacter]MDA3054346.1 hypothetical protein [Campylobacter sp. VBCF_07 NA4]MDA3061038.1 hypothetical protein [Campylobacter sp. VBCF_02 NA5]MDA3070552.1 hypothetical protein [Campylobacter sp. VBCF_08 NA3]WBR53855.1 hypothetical protein PF027_05885 [Campylobacter sp. VBCF_01 NA2]
MATLDLTNENFAVELLSYYLWGKTENFTAQVKFKKSFNAKFMLNFEFKFPWIDFAYGSSKCPFASLGSLRSFCFGDKSPRNDSKFSASNFKVVDCHEFC